MTFPGLLTTKPGPKLGMGNWDLQPFPGPQGCQNTACSKGDWVMPAPGHSISLPRSPAWG